MYRITAYSKDFKRRVHIFTWTRDPDSGVRRAERECKRFGLQDRFSDFRAEALEAPAET